MLTFNVTLPTKPVSANADLGRAVVGPTADFRLNAQLDSSRTVRSNPTVGAVTIAHTSSKELGGRADRHLFRVDLAQNGDLSPATAQLTLVNVPTAIGKARLAEAFNLLHAALLEFAFREDPGFSDYSFSSTSSAGNGIPNLALEGALPTIAVGGCYGVVLDRLTNNEG